MQKIVGTELLAVRATAAECLRGFKDRISVKDSRLFPASGTRGRPATTAGPTCSLPRHPSTWNAVALLAPSLQVFLHACSWVLWILESSERWRRNSRQMKATGQSRGLAKA